MFVGASPLRKIINKQLQYIKRNLTYIQQLLDEVASLLELSNKQYKMLLVVAELYCQKLWVYENKKRSIEDRIVSLSKLHIPPIVPGKVAKNQEFGASSQLVVLMLMYF